MTRLQTSLVLGGLGLALAVAGCGGAGTAQHPLTAEIDPALKTLKLNTLAGLPFSSDVSETDDPDRLAASMFESKFYGKLSATTGFTVLPSSEVGREIGENGMEEELKSFYKKWISDPSDVDADFIKQVAGHMKADAIVAGAVDIWYQRSIDLTESGSARTTVGGFVGLFDGATGKRLWYGRDENFKEALRHTAKDLGKEAENRAARGEMERTNLRTATGVYAPPDYPEVMDVVVNALVGAFPKRVQ
jgi:hypothetical protein